MTLYFIYILLLEIIRNAYLFCIRTYYVNCWKRYIKHVFIGQGRSETEINLIVTDFYSVIELIIYTYNNNNNHLL